MDDLGNRIALRNGDADSVRVQVSRGVVHADDQGTVIHIRVQLVCSGADFVLGVRHGGKQLEKPLVLDQSGILQLVRDGADSVIRRYFNSGGDILFVECAQVVDQQPTHTCQNSGSDQNEQKIHQNIKAALFPLAGTMGRGALFALAPAHLLRIPAGGISPFIISHMNLHTLPLRPAGRKRLALSPVFCDGRKIYNGQAPKKPAMHRMSQSEVTKSCASTTETMTVPACGSF